MIDITKIEEEISEYYDGEMSNSKLIEFEKKLAQSEMMSQLVNDRCFDYFKISNSIKLTKLRSKDNAQYTIKNILKNEKLFDVDSVFAKRIYKHLRGFLLNIGRNDS